MYHIKFPNRTASLLTLNSEFAYVEPALTPEAHAALCLFVPDVVVAHPDQGTPGTYQSPDKHLPLRKQFAIGDDLIDHIQDNAIPCYVRGYEGSWLTLGYYHSDYTAPRGTAEGLTKTGKKVDTRFKQRQLVEFLKGDLKGNRGYIQNLTSPTSYAVALDNGKVVDYPAEHLGDGSNKDANKDVVKPAHKLQQHDHVIIMLPDNTRTHSEVLTTPHPDNYTTVHCYAPNQPKAHFDRAYLIYVQPETSRRIGLEDIQEGDQMRVVTGTSVADATKRKPGEILLGDIVTFDSWVPDDGEMKVRLQCHEGLHNAARFQKA